MKDNIKKIIFLVIVVVGGILLTLFMKDKINNATPNTELSDTLAAIIKNASNELKNTELTKAVVTKVVDGDTLWVKIDGKEEKVRLIGVNCPEYTKEIEPFGKEATEYTTDKLLGKTVYLQKDISNTDSYDRLLRYVWTKDISSETQDENTFDYLFNNNLVKEGLAESNFYKPDILYQKILETSEIDAKSEKKGMWQ